MPNYPNPDSYNAKGYVRVPGSVGKPLFQASAGQRLLFKPELFFERLDEYVLVSRDDSKAVSLPVYQPEPDTKGRLRFVHVGGSDLMAVCRNKQERRI
jgi:hypothetical protein